MKLKLTELFEDWKTDCKIDNTQLDLEACRIPELHHKYLKLYTAERLKYRKAESDLKRLRLEKFEFYTQGPTQSQLDKGWKLPPVGKIIKQHVERYLDADEDLVKAILLLDTQKEKLNAIESILNMINYRSQSIRAAVDFLKWTKGVG